ncbi:5,6-dimethylbenzimidazole synthase [Cohaesibacter gelatinilyticus]|nr:5,6-dimethylbenzimidazole synthase [Cohaesibacter gelatinilyticus]
MDQKLVTYPHFDQAFREKFEDLLRWRRDIRHFEQTSVDPRLIQSCLTMANLAPSVGLSQPWRFVELENPARRTKVIRSFEKCNASALQAYEGEKRHLYTSLKLEGLRQAPVQFAVFCDERTSKGDGLGKQSMPEMLNYSVVTAIYSFWLAARAHGLGVGWVSILEPSEIREACDVPDHWSLIAYLCVGWPALDPNISPELERRGWENRQPHPDFYKKL